MPQGRGTMMDGQQDFLEAVQESSLTPEQKREWERVCLWEAVDSYAAACGGNTGSVSNARMNAVVEVEQAVELIGKARAAEMCGSLESGIRGDVTTVHPNWVYEARDAIQHQNANIPWLIDLLAALGWQSGTIHDALSAVRRLVEAAKPKCDACGYPNDENGGCTRSQCYNAD